MPASPNALLVDVSGQRLALALGEIVEVSLRVLVHPLPGSAPPIEGVVIRHGELVPLVDLRVALGMAPVQPRLADQFVFMRGPGRLVALWVDQVLGLHTVHASLFEAAREHGVRMESDERVELVASDVNPTWIEHAERARYRPWSSRGVDPGIVRAFFEPCDGMLRPIESVRRLVRFSRANLLRTTGPAGRRPFALPAVAWWRKTERRARCTACRRPPSRPEVPRT